MRAHGIIHRDADALLHVDRGMVPVLRDVQHVARPQRALQRRQWRAADARVEPPRPAKTAAVQFTFGVSDMRAPQINQLEV